MKVTVRFLGPLGIYVGKKTVEFDLPEGSTYGDLLDDIWSRFGKHFPEGIWDPAIRGFKRQVLAVGMGRDLESRETILKDGEHIKMIPFLPGG